VAEKVLGDIQLLMVSRSRLAREGLVQLLREFDHIAVCAAHALIEQAIPTILADQPDIVVVDVSDGDHSASISTFRSLGIKSFIVVYGVCVDIESVIPYARAGVSGYVRSDASRTEWDCALRSVLQGHVSDPVIAGILNRYIASQLAEPVAPGILPGTDRAWSVKPAVGRSAARVGLTPREQQVLSLVDEGLSTKRIARRLHCSPSTVKAHVASILTKYQVHRRAEAAAIFRKSKLGRSLDSARRA